MKRECGRRAVKRECGIWLRMNFRSEGFKMEEIMKKRTVSLILTAVLTAGLLAACGSSTAQTGAESQPASAESAAETTAPTESAADAAESTEAAEGADAAETTAESKGTITVAATSVPHAEILAAAAPILAEQGWTLEVTEFTDYIMPNEVVESEEIDANYFQHITYLESFNEERGTHLVSAGSITMSPLASIPASRAIFPLSRTERKSRCLTTPPTRRELYCFCRSRA